jgi:gliding motility-associated-like protein
VQEYKTLPGKEIAWYTVQAEDSCGNRSEESNIGKPIRLTGENRNNEVFFLQWTPYEGWANGVKNYALQYLPDLSATVSIQITSQKEFEDVLRPNSPDDKQCYRVVAYEQSGTQFSRSNILCLPHIPVVWIPNAFSPNKDGINDTFKVVSLGMSELSLTIYDRWGQRVLSSDSGTATWDGTKDGGPLPTGVYVFTLSGRTNKSERIYKTGTITLMR